VLKLMMVPSTIHDMGILHAAGLSAAAV
jgi:hypothetical protein